MPTYDMLPEPVVCSAYWLHSSVPHCSTPISCVPPPPLKASQVPVKPLAAMTSSEPSSKLEIMPGRGSQAPASTHCPAAQFWPSGQAIPQPPQLLRSVMVLAHVPLQSVWLGPQPQTPPVQLCPVGQALPHAPQCCALVIGLTQVPSHEMLPATGQPQLPPAQLSLAPHMLSQAPQWLRLVFTSTQLLPHWVSVAAQVPQT